MDLRVVLSLRISPTGRWLFLLSWALLSLLPHQFYFLSLLFDFRLHARSHHIKKGMLECLFRRPTFVGVVHEQVFHQLETILGNNMLGCLLPSSLVVF